MDQIERYLPLVFKKKEHCYFVPVSHYQLDHLIGRLMQMCELTGDIEQRKALKDEIKLRARAWLNDLYTSAGYDSFEGTKKDARIIED